MSFGVYNITMYIKHIFSFLPRQKLYEKNIATFLNNIKPPCYMHVHVQEMLSKREVKVKSFRTPW